MVTDTLLNAQTGNHQGELGAATPRLQVPCHLLEFTTPK